jgi:anthranilate synthase component 2
MKCIIIDNYDSFTYNLVQLLRRTTGIEPVVKRNDSFAIDQLAEYDKILLSPGPGVPSDAGLLLEVIRHYGASKSILGICLGHQAIGEVFGAELIRMPKVYHGISSKLKVCKNDALFHNLPVKIDAGRYHSWILSKEGFPENLEVTMEDEHGNIMAIRHKKYDVKGLQFHPESILTPYGSNIITNWINGNHE